MIGPNVIVIDAAVMVTALADDGLDGTRARARIGGDELAAPELLDLEVTSAFRKMIAADRLPVARAEQALADLVALPLRRASHIPLLGRCWELRANLTVYDAAYVALAEALGTRLLTSDARLAASPGPRCDIELVSRG